MKKVAYILLAVFFFIALAGAVYYHNGLHDRCPFCSTGKPLSKSFAAQSFQPQLYLLIILIPQIAQNLFFSIEAPSPIDVRAPPLVFF